MTTLKFADTHNMVGFLSKPTKSDGFEQIVDFLNAHPIRYALTINPTIYISCIEQFWSTVKAKTINGEEQLYALVDGKKIIITESSVRRDLPLADEEGVDCLPNSTIFEQLTLMGPKTTTWNEFSSTMASTIIYEAVHKELGDSLVRAATTASSLEAEQDSGNINKTQSKATPNESSSLRTTSGGGPRYQETMRDTIAQTRFESVSKHSNDSLLARESDGFEQIIDFSNAHPIRYALTINPTIYLSCIEQFWSIVVAKNINEEEQLHALVDGKKIIITESSIRSDLQLADEEGTDDDGGDATTVSVATTTDDNVDITLAQALIEMKSTKPKDKGKGVLIKHVKPMNKKDLIRLDEETTSNLQAEFDEEERLAREKAEKEEEANITYIQAKINVDHQLAERMQAQEQEELSIEEKATLFQ
ncbi:hypothetical protein Tco_0214441 [Tanacetum coccineum]